MMTKVYVGDVGTVITLDCGQNISAATARVIAARKPSGALVSWTASASGTDSITFTTVSGTFDEDGVWKLQAVITLPSGVRRGETANLPVHAHFN